MFECLKPVLLTLMLAMLSACATTAPRMDLGNLDSYKDRLIAYKMSGAYDHDVAATDAQAEAFMVAHVSAVQRPAIVLDIDETSLSNWDELYANGLTFRMDGPCDHLPKGPCGLKAWQGIMGAPALAPTLRLYKTAQRLGVAVFFITGRDETVRDATARNLRKAGYDDGWAELIMRKAHSTTPSATDYKAPQRARIEAEGYTILVNIGDQPSDLAGGHAERAFLLPNPYYRIP